MQKRATEANQSSLISRTSILIFSAFLVGVTIGHVDREDSSLFLIACGVCGCLAFIGLDAAGNRREELQQQAEQASMERRLERHLNPAPTLTLFDVEDLDWDAPPASPSPASAEAGVPRRSGSR